jgi:hypothetical protein
VVSETSSLALTIEEAAAWLDPPVRAAQLRAIIGALEIPRTGTRRRVNGGPGRPYDVYDAGLLLRLHAAIVPFLPCAAPEQDVRPGASQLPGVIVGRG